MASRRRELLGVALVLMLGTAATEAWRSHRDSAWAPQIVQQARPGDIRMISSVTCMYCTQARVWMTDAGVPFDECFIERDPACASQFRALGGQGTPLLLVRGKPQLGFSPERLAQLLAPGNGGGAGTGSAAGS